MSTENTPSATDQVPSTTDDTPPPAAPTAPEAPPAPPSSDLISFKDNKALSDRMDRHYESKLKKLGIEDATSLKDDLAELAKYRESQEEQRKADMSEQERLKEQHAQEAARAEKAETRLREMEYDIKIRDLCGDLNITNLDYARFKLAQAAKSHTGEAAFDAKTALEAALAADAVALGAKKPDPVNTPATTGPKGDPPPASPNTGGPVDATKMSDDEFRRFCAERGY